MPAKHPKGSKRKPTTPCSANRQSQTHKTPFKTVLKLCLLVVALAGILFIAVLISPVVRQRVFNSPFSAALIRLYNEGRPALNLGNDALCVKKLKQVGVIFTPVADRTEETGCTLRYVAQVSQSYLPYNSARLMTCSLAFALYQFEKDVVQPAALKHFQQPVTKITHWGTYNCRPMRGQQTLLSEHAYANAIDIAAFQLSDGTMISVKNDWKEAGTKTAFLHDIARRACGIFRNVLTPNYNDLHKDHFHLDQGFWGQCGY